MSGFKRNDDFNERLGTAAKAKQASLEKFRARPRADDPAVTEQQAARLATSQARDARKAARAAETARLQAEEIRQAADEVERKATAEAEQAAQKDTLEAERKTARDGPLRRTQGAPAVTARTLRLAWRPQFVPTLGMASMIFPW
jgi:hypothetical protein